MTDTRRSQSTLATNLPDNTSGLITPQDVRDLNISTHPEKTIQTGAQGSIPGSGQLTGDLYLPNNGYYLHRYSGSAWVPWGPLFPMTPPVAGDFAWINQGGASYSTTNGGLYLSAPPNSGDAWRVLKKAAPSTPYTVTAALLPLLRGTGSYTGLVWRESSSGKLVGIGWNSAQFVAYKMNSPTAYAGSTYFALNRYSDLSQWAGGALWLRLADTGSDRTVAFSVDGQNFLTIHTVGRTDFLTADEIGIVANNYGNDYSASETLLSWKEA